MQRRFSNKPMIGGIFTDFYEKIESYLTIISGPAMEMHGANPYTFRTVEDMSNSVFKFHDTLTSRAEITDLSAKFAEDVVAVIGLGGTGAYVLDFLVKTAVREIRGFDFDRFHVHNAFRSPGRLEESELGKPKADVYRRALRWLPTRIEGRAQFPRFDVRGGIRGCDFCIRVRQQGFVACHDLRSSYC